MLPGKNQMNPPPKKDMINIMLTGKKSNQMRDLQKIEGGKRMGQKRFEEKGFKKMGNLWRW